MPELLIHFAVSYALAVTIFGIRRGLLIAFIATLPDVDALFYIHRSATHSIVILLTILAIPTSLIIVRRKRISGFYIGSALSLLSHPILDAFQTYTPILYPVLDKGYWVGVGANVVIADTVKPYINLNVSSKPISFTPFSYFDAPIATNEGVLISLLLITIPTLYSIAGKKHLQREKMETNYPSHIPLQLNLDDPVEGSAYSNGQLHDLTVIVPTLNEEESIGGVIGEIKENGFEKIIVVDGYSRDKTAEIARSMGATVIMQEGVGKAAAVRTAIKNVKTKYLLVMDGDGTYPASEIHKLLRHASQYDMIIGARKEGRENIPIMNRFGNWVISKAFKLLMGKPITDVCSGMYLIRTDIARSLEISTTSFDVEVEIASQVAVNGRITEVPISYRRRIGQRKLNPVRDGIRIIVTLLWMANYYNPVILYSMLVALAAIPASAILLWVLYENFVNKVWHSGFALFGVMLLLLATQGAAVAAMSLLIKRVEDRLRNELRLLRTASRK